VLPTLRKITIALLMLQCLSFQIAAEDGMALLACETTGYGDWPCGQIRRIDVKGSVVINTTAALNGGTIGHHMRFNPRGDQFAFLVGDPTPENSPVLDTVRICNLDGAEIRHFAAPNTGGAGYISWTNSGIWVSGQTPTSPGTLTLYDTLGVKIRDYAGGGLAGYRTYVSQNDQRGACVDEVSWRPWVFSMVRGTAFQLSIPAGATEGGCSVCPSPNGLMITNNLVANSAGGVAVDYHVTMRIVDSLGKQLYYLRLQDITRFPVNGYRWNTQAWSSNSNDWILIPVGQDGGTWVPTDNLSACIYNINSKEKICIVDNSGKSQWWMIYDYYSGKVPGSTTPSLQLSPTALSFAADSGAANPTTQTVTASTANGTLQGLAVSGAKSWLTVTPAATTGASIAITNAPKLAGLIPNTYLDTIAVTTTNASSAKYVVTLTVRRPAATAVLTSMKVAPGVYTIAPGASVNFLATCKDQAGNYVTSATLNWSAGGGGTIDQAGRYTAAAAPSHGPHLIIVTATSGAVTLRDTAMIMVTRGKLASVHKKIDCGANSLVPAGWETDDAYVTGGSDGANLASVTTAGVSGAAPAEVYRSFRRGNPHSYRIPRLPQSAYTVRMHFVDWKDTVRSMSYSILGANVLNDFRIVPVAGAANKALVLDFNGSITDTNGLPISCSATAGDVFEAGLEIMQNRLSAICVLSPLGGSTQQFRVGQNMQVTWISDTVQTNVIFLMLAPDSKNFFIADTIVRAKNRAAWGSYTLTIPDSIGLAGSRVSMVSTATAKCRLKLQAYFSPDPTNPINDISDSAFTILPNSLAAGKHAGSGMSNRLRCTASGGKMMIRVSSAMPYRIDVFTLKGDLVCSFDAAGDRQFAIPRSAGMGTRLVCMKTKSGVSLTKMISIGAGN